MKAIHRLFAVIIFIIMLSCKKDKQLIHMRTVNASESYTIMKSLDWLEGHWERHSSENNTTEVWEKVNDSTFTGYAYTLKGSDTISYETIQLNQRKDSVHYVVTTKYQNDQKPVAFALQNAENDNYVFENPKHDFPFRITYTKISNDSLLAQITGLHNKDTVVIDFPMVKKK